MDTQGPTPCPQQGSCQPELDPGSSRNYSNGVLVAGLRPRHGLRGVAQPGTLSSVERPVEARATLRPGSGARVAPPLDADEAEAHHGHEEGQGCAPVALEPRGVAAPSVR